MLRARLRLSVGSLLSSCIVLVLLWGFGSNLDNRVSNCSSISVSRWPYLLSRRSCRALESASSLFLRDLLSSSNAGDNESSLFLWMVAESVVVRPLRES